MRRCLVPICALTALAASAVTYGQASIGPAVGVFFPSSGALRDAIGPSWISFGLGHVDTQKYDRTKVAPNFNVISGDGNGNRVFIVSYTLGVTQPLSQVGLSRSSFVPYVAYRGGLSYTDYAVTMGGSRVGGKALGYDINAEIGILFNKNLTLSARYDLVSEHDGLNFNGLSLSLQYGIARF